MTKCQYCDEEATDGGLCVKCDDQWGEMNRDYEPEEGGFDYE